MIKAKKKSLKTRPIVEVCSEPMMIIDETGVVTDLNAASIKIHSKTRKKLTGYLFVNLFTKPNVAKKIYSQIKKVRFQSVFMNSAINQLQINKINKLIGAS